MVHTNVAGDIFARLQGAAAGAVLPAAAGRAGAPRQPRRPDHRAADAGPAPQRLLQPRLPRPLSRAAAGGRRRPARRPATACSLKTLHGLMPIDLIVRCVAGARRRPAGARRLGLRRAGRPAAGRAPASRLRRQCAGLGARREPRPERLPAAARQDAAGRGAAHRRRTALVARRCRQSAQHVLANLEQHGHPPGARGHRAARPRHSRASTRPGWSQTERDSPAAGDRDQGRRAGGRGEDRLRHHAVADAGRAGAQALCAAPVRDRDQPTASRSCRAAWP